MKNVICAKDIEEFAKQGKKIFTIDVDTIITPSAQDAANILNVKFTTDTCITNHQSAKCDNNTDIDVNKIYEAFKIMSEKGLLNGIFDCVPSNPYNAEGESGGVKLIRGDSVRFDYFDTGDSNVKAYYQELISKDDSSMSAGFLTIEDSKFDWELTYEEIDYVIGGTLMVTINGKKYTAHAGDVLFVPSGSKVVWESPDKAKLFYVTYPANWADLMT